MWDFIIEHGTLFVAIYGVAQVWLIWLWKRYIWTGHLSVFKTGPLEVSYSNFGPTLALNGTLRVQRKELFINEISIVVVKERDGSTHNFEWTAFRSPQLRLSHSDSIELELPSGFIVREDQPHRYHIFFSDRRTAAELVPSLHEAAKAWQDYIVSRQDDLLTHTLSDTLPSALSNLHKDFTSKSTELQSAWQALDRKNYWEAGDYSLKFTVQTAKPDKTFSEEWRFTLSADDSKRLRLNSISALDELCMGKVNYFFAFVEYAP